jgi:phosphatidylserine/phosphatidylglycerophosphate/cardiolipin synthase-like enzyme
MATQCVLLQEAAENYPAWLAAIQEAQHRILFENYIVDDDAVGREFAEALAARARAGVDVRIVYDWLGSYRARSLWPLLASAGAKVQAFNRPRLDSPLGWVTRDHRKTLIVDGKVAFVSGLCVSEKWLGDPKRDMDPWRDTGIEIRGPAVAEIAQAFATVWHACTGEWVPENPADAKDARAVAGDIRLRVVAGAPSSAGTYRLDLVIASLARKRLWISDAYFVGTSAYVQALAARGARRRRRATAGAWRERHPRAIADLARGLPSAPRRWRARVRMGRDDDAREDGRGRRPGRESARRISTSRAGWAITSWMSRSRTAVRRADGCAVRERSHAAQPRSC